jgi:hypothetical protein
MKELLRKLNFREHKRIAVINAPETFFNDVIKCLKDIVVDKEIDQRCPYEFMIFFVTGVGDVDDLAPSALHNLTADGVLWFCYPKKTSERYSAGLDRDRGWKALNNAGFHGIRMVAIDADWSAMRFRNIKYIKSSSDRLGK